MNTITEITMHDALPLMRETLNAGAPLRITAHGTSMRPLLRGGEEVELISPPARLRRYTMAFYIRSSGSFVLHRVAKVHRDGTYTMCGDNQIGLESGIAHRQILGVVTRFQSDGSWISTDNPAYRAYARRRVRSRAWRVLWGKLYRWYKRGKRREES
ncbi:MAG: S24/S26 family peptidase [Clostridiales bacterium]|nr:S24/S26 family peptidase [Clostridiales bacterium]